VNRRGGSLGIFFASLTDRRNGSIIKVMKGGEVDEMDVPPRNPLLDLWLSTPVLSKT